MRDGAPPRIRSAVARSRCRRASYSRTAAATETLRLSATPSIGIRTGSTRGVVPGRAEARRPRCRGRSRAGRAGRRPCEVALGVDPRRDDADAVPASQSSDVRRRRRRRPARLKIVPRLARIAFGLKRSVRGSAAMTASAPAPSAVRRIAPRLPGFSTASTTTTSGSAGETSGRRGRSTASGRSRRRRPIGRRRRPCAMTGLASPMVSPTTPASRPTTARASSVRTSASQTNASSTSTPASSARDSSRAPSTIVRPVVSRSRRSRSRTAALIRGLARLVIALGHGHRADDARVRTRAAGARRSVARRPSSPASTSRSRRRNAARERVRQPVGPEARRVRGQDDERGLVAGQRGTGGEEVRAAAPRAATVGRLAAVAVARRVEDDAVVAPAAPGLARDERFDVVDDPADRPVGQARQLGVATRPGDRRPRPVDVGHGRARRGRGQRRRAGVGEQVEDGGRRARAGADRRRGPRRGSRPAPGTGRPGRSASGAARTADRRPSTVPAVGDRAARAPSSRRRDRTAGRPLPRGRIDAAARRRPAPADRRRGRRTAPGAARRRRRSARVGCHASGA